MTTIEAQVVAIVLDIRKAESGMRDAKTGDVINHHLKKIHEATQAITALIQEARKYEVSSAMVSSDPEYLHKRFEQLNSGKK